MKFMAMEPGSEVFDRPRHCKALAVRCAVSPLDVGEKAIGITTGMVVPVFIFLSEHCAQWCATGICVEKELLAEIGLDQTGKRNQSLLEEVERLFVLGGP